MSAGKMPAAVFVGEGVLKLQSPPGHPATPGVILGHELIGSIAGAGDAVVFVNPGDRVAVAPNLNCGRCGYCKAGLVNHCENFTTVGIFRDGGLAHFCVVPERACHRISPDLPFEDAIWTEVLSCVVNSVQNMKPVAGESALVLGGGPAGALHAQLLMAAGARVIVSDIQPLRLELLKKIGIQRTVDVGKESLDEAVKEEFDWGADIVVDAVGTLLDQALGLVRVGGRISLFGMNSQAAPAVRQNTITRKELVVYGSYVGTHMFPKTIAILESGVIKPSLLISEVVGLESLPDALERLGTGQVMKTVINHGVRP